MKAPWMSRQHCRMIEDARASHDNNNNNSSRTLNNINNNNTQQSIRNENYTRMSHRRSQRQMSAAFFCAVLVTTLLLNVISINAQCFGSTRPMCLNQTCPCNTARCQWTFTSTDGKQLDPLKKRYIFEKSCQVDCGRFGLTGRCVCVCFFFFFFFFLSVGCGAVRSKVFAPVRILLHVQQEQHLLQ
jgi:hypothetical protein